MQSTAISPQQDAFTMLIEIFRGMREDAREAQKGLTDRHNSLEKKIDRLTDDLSKRRESEAQFQNSRRDIVDQHFRNLESKVGDLQRELDQERIKNSNLESKLEQKISNHRQEMVTNFAEFREVAKTWREEQAAANAEFRKDIKKFYYALGGLAALATGAVGLASFVT